MKMMNRNKNNKNYSKKINHNKIDFTPTMNKTKNALINKSSKMMTNKVTSVVLNNNNKNKSSSNQSHHLPSSHHHPPLSQTLTIIYSNPKHCKDFKLHKPQIPS